ncbi:MAG: hypothetical protein LBK61_11185 [Spirochaetaceae bacterium]|nr:hypothetical protein [Spirochaetaceae bacterium]
MLALLVNPLAAGTFGQFTVGEMVITTIALLRVIDYQRSEDVSGYLVAVNDRSVTKPFYIADFYLKCEFQGEKTS